MQDPLPGWWLRAGAVSPAEDGAHQPCKLVEGEESWGLSPCAQDMHKVALGPLKKKSSAAPRPYHLQGFGHLPCAGVNVTQQSCMHWTLVAVRWGLSALHWSHRGAQLPLK